MNEEYHGQTHFENKEGYGINISNTPSITISGCRVSCDICKSRIADDVVIRGELGFDEALKISHHAKLKPWLQNKVTIIPICKQCKEVIIFDAIQKGGI